MNDNGKISVTMRNVQYAQNIQLNCKSQVRTIEIELFEFNERI